MKTKRNEKRPFDKVATWDEVQFNLRSQAYYALGEVQAVWYVLDGVWNATDNPMTKEKKLLQKVFDALTRFDDEVRSRMRKKGMVK